MNLDDFMDSVDDFLDLALAAPMVRYDNHRYFFCLWCSATCEMKPIYKYSEVTGKEMLSAYVPGQDPFPHKDDCKGVKFFVLAKKLKGGVA